jgi:hypothetical protein
MHVYARMNPDSKTKLVAVVYLERLADVDLLQRAIVPFGARMEVITNFLPKDEPEPTPPPPTPWFKKLFAGRDR